MSAPSQSFNTTRPSASSSPFRNGMPKLTGQSVGGRVPTQRKSPDTRFYHKSMESMDSPMHKIEIRFFMILRLSTCKIQHNFRISIFPENKFKKSVGLPFPVMDLFLILHLGCLCLYSKPALIINLIYKRNA